MRARLLLLPPQISSSPQRSGHNHDPRPIYNRLISRRAILIVRSAAQRMRKPSCNYRLRFNDRFLGETQF